MGILFDKKRKLFHLQTPNSSYIFKLLGKGTLLHLYYGKRIENTENIEDTMPECSIGFSAVSREFIDLGMDVSKDVIPQEFPLYGNTDLRKPAFHAQYKDGSRITDVTYKGHKIYKSKPKLNGLPATYTEGENEAETIEIELTDELTGLEFILRYSVFEDFDAITRSISVKNGGKDDINIKSIASCNIDFTDNDFDFIHLWGSWARERHIERIPVIRGRCQVESRRGSSSHHHSPFFALARKNTDEDNGEVYGFSFLYSGNFEAGAEVDAYGVTRAYMGINSFDFNWLLKSGESFDAPEVVCVYSKDGIGEMSRTYHKLYKKRLCRGKYRDIERPVLINNWEGTYFDFNEEKILNIAKKAKSLGVELMVLDDGWFGKRNDDFSSLGDWFVNREKLPDGIEGLAKKINDLNMRFGLWFEPEMISVESELYKKHPDWCLHVNGRGRSEGRNQLILDLSRDDVCDYMIGFLSDALDSSPISYIKWDMNRNMSEIGSALLPPERQQETAHRYMLGLYKVLETVTQKYPDVLFEGCSGGGGRFDAGMLYYFSQYWTSDDTDAIERLYIQHGTSMVMPACTMGAHVSAVPNHQLGRTTPLKTRGNVAMCGQFGYELDVNCMSEEELTEVKRQIELYKSVREVIHQGDMYRLKSPFEDDDTAWEYISEDKKTVVLVYVCEKKTPAVTRKLVRLKGLMPDKKYKLRGTDKVFGGDMLENLGLVQKPLNEFDSEIYVFDMI